jgi:hypothetical protein
VKLEIEKIDNGYLLRRSTAGDYETFCFQADEPDEDGMWFALENMLKKVADEYQGLTIGGITIERKNRG